MLSESVPNPSNSNPFSYLEALAEPERLLAAYFKSSTVGLCILDTQFRYLAINETLARMNGVPVNDRLGRTVRQILGSAADPIEAILRTVLATGDPTLEIEISAQLPTRNEIGHWIAYYIPIKNADERVERIGVVVNEITDRKKLEKSLHELTGRLRQQMARLQMLLEVGNILNSNWNIQQVFSSIQGEGLQSLCCVPLVRRKGPLGVFILGSTRQHAFQSDDLSLLSQVAAQFAIAIENHRSYLEIEALKQRLTEEKKYLEGEIRSEGHFSEIIGESPVLKEILAKVATVASSDATVLILGETGTGKELIARALHKMSRRAQKTFVKVNCAAIPTGLLESELFGHEKGAFTGASFASLPAEVRVTTRS